MPGIDETKKFVPLKIAVLTVSDTRALADDKSPLVSEYARAFMKRMNDRRSPEQLSLPIG